MTTKVVNTGELQAFEDFAASTHQMSIDFEMSVHERNRARRKITAVYELSDVMAA